MAMTQSVASSSICDARSVTRHDPRDHPDDRAPDIVEIETLTHGIFESHGANCRLVENKMRGVGLVASEWHAFFHLQLELNAAGFEYLPRFIPLNHLLTDAVEYPLIWILPFRIILEGEDC